MQIKELLHQGREIWNERMSIGDIIIALGVVFGDMARWARNAKKDMPGHTDQELKKELGNVIFSTIRWCDDMGYDPEECISLAIEAQKKYQK